MTNQTSEIEEAFKHVQDFIDCIDEEGLDRENNQRHYRTVLKLARQAEVFSKTLEWYKNNCTCHVGNHAEKALVAAEELK